MRIEFTNHFHTVASRENISKEALQKRLLLGLYGNGKLGEISTNHKDDQELSILCLHLLQVCMVYINTLIIQDVLSESEWENILTTADKRALSPLIHAHINPYGLFPLDLKKRIRIIVPDETTNVDPDEVAA